MSNATSIDTWAALRDFGYTPDPAVISDEMPGLSIDFGSFKLSASVGMNRGFRPVIMFSGVLVTSRTFCEVHFELPCVVASRNTLAAFMVYYLDNAAGDRALDSEREIWWLAEGRQHRHLLPWEIERAAYEARPYCYVKREWMRLALKNLTELLAKADDAREVEFAFNGSVLLIQCIGQVIAMPAAGTAWPTKFTIPAERLRQLPKRLLDKEVGVSVYKGLLHIGRMGYKSVAEILP